MKTKQIILSLSLIGFLVVAMSSCTKDSDLISETEMDDSGSDELSGQAYTIGTTAVSTGTAEGGSQTGEDEDDLIANSSFASTVKIVMGTTATITNPLDGNGVTVSQSDGDVTITATASEVEYELSGSTTSGSVKIYSDKKFKLTLAGVSITNNDGPAINIQSGKRVFVEIKDNTTNSLTDAATYASSDEDQKGTFFSEGQLIFLGSGTLTIEGNNKHGIVSDDYIRIQAGTINITKAATDGIHTNDAVIIDGGTLNITASSDGIEAEEGYIIINGGNITINAADDGIAASWEDDDTIDPYVTINGGTINITATEGEGIESKSVLTINAGDINIKAVDDGLNASSYIYINGGTLYVYSTTNDAIDSNGPLTITGGTVMAVGAASPEAGFDCDNNTFKITGGLLIGLGGSTSVPTANASTQASAILGSGSASQIYSIIDADNKEIMTFKSPVSFATTLLSSGAFSVGSTYTLATVSSVSDAETFGGFYQGGSFSSPTAVSTFTLTSTVSQLGGNTGGGQGGGR